MAKGTWNIFKKESGGTWVADGTIHRPNSNLPIRKLSTQTVIKLANGDDAFVTPTTKYINEPLSFSWAFDDGTMKTKIEDYIDNQDDLKIVDHNNVEYYGRFISIEPVWIVGLSEDDERYDITANFKRMPSLA